MAEIERRHRDKPREEEREYRRRDDHRHRQRSRSPHERHDGHHHRHKEGSHDDQSRGRASRERHMHRHHGSHDPPRRMEDSHSASDHDRHSSATGERRRGGEYRTDNQRIGRDSGGREREERPHDKGANRSRDERSLADGGEARRPREGERGGGREQRGRGGGRRQPKRERNEEEDLSNYEYGGGRAQPKDGEGGEEGEESKDGTDLDPNYGLSGKLTAETNTFRGVVIKYNEPEEARVPRIRWRLYPFKGEESLPTLYIHRQSAYLIGRERKICDMPVDHPSCSKQHAVIQYRLVNYTKADGSQGRRVRPYVIDLESTNGTYVNNQRIEAARYYELKEKDMLKFGFSSREYILLHENSRGDEDDEPLSEGETEGGAAGKGGGADDSNSGSNSASEDESKPKKKKKSHRNKK